jgi:hypothetical protein
MPKNPSILTYLQFYKMFSNVSIDISTEKRFFDKN